MSNDDLKQRLQALNDIYVAVGDAKVAAKAFVETDMKDPAFLRSLIRSVAAQVGIMELYFQDIKQTKKEKPNGEN